MKTDKQDPRWRNRFSTPGAERTSEIFRAIADDQRDRVTIRLILETLGGRSFGGMLIVLSPFGIVPVIGNVAAMMMLLLGLQMAFGRAYPYCPARLADYPFKPGAMRGVLRRMLPFIVFSERFVRLRLEKLTRRPFDLLIGAIVGLLSVVVILPLPFLDLLPLAAVFVMALAVLERDGIALVAGVVLAVLTFLAVGVILNVGTTALLHVWQ